MANNTVIGNLELRSTYKCISVYAPFSGDDNHNNFAFVEYRAKGTEVWKFAMFMTPDTRTIVGDALSNTYVNQWRVSILGLQQDTLYEVRVTFNDSDGVSGTNPAGEIQTRSEVYPLGGFIIDVNPGTAQDALNSAMPGDTIRLHDGNYGSLNLPDPGGSPDAYTAIAAYPGEHPIINAGTASAGITVRGSYWLVRDGLEVTGGIIGIWVGPPHALKWGPDDHQPNYVVIEDCILRDPKTLSSTPAKWVGILLGGTSTGYTTYVGNITIQRNKIYLVEPGATNSGVCTGPGIWMQNANGGHVFRDNDIIYTGTVAPNVHGMDGIVSSPNFTIDFTLRDMDIYRNRIQGATDDAISLDGNSANVRVWENEISRANIGISVAPVIIGPAYIFHNVFRDPEIHWIGVNRWVKGGEDGTGQVYFYHNTVVYDNLLVGSTFPNGSGKNSPANYGYSLGAGSGQQSRNVHSLNNIIEVNGPVCVEKFAEPIMDYDLIYNPISNPSYRPYWIMWNDIKLGDSSHTNEQNLQTFRDRFAQELNGVAGQATFVDRAGGDFHLADGSLGVDQGVIIPGVNDENSPWPYQGGGPNMGAFESASEPLPSYTLTIEAKTGGTTSPPPGIHNYLVGSMVLVTAIASNGYHFDHWELNGQPITDKTIQIEMNSSATLIAFFEAETVMRALTILSQEGGSTSPLPGTYSYPDGQTVPVSATPYTGYYFDHWELDGQNSADNPIELTMTDDISMQPIFRQVPTYTLTIADATGGTTSPPAGQHSYIQDTEVFVAAMVSAGYLFDHWTLNGQIISDNPVQLIITANATLTPVFSQIPTYTLTIAATPGGTTNPAPDSPHKYEAGTIVTVTALPSAGYLFVEWQENDIAISTDKSIQVLMDADRNITAVFQEIEVPPEEFAVTISVLGEGTTEPVPDAYTVPADSFFPVTAKPFAGYKFDHWEGDISETTAEVTFQVTSNMSIIAVFVEAPAPPYPGPGVFVGALAATSIFIVLVAIAASRRTT